MLFKYMLNSLFDNIHWGQVLLLTVLSFVLGALWHHKRTFGNAWKAENYPEGSPKVMNVPLMFAGSAVFHFISIAGLSALVSGRGADIGFYAGAAVSLLWVLPAMGGTYLFASRSLKLLAIDAGNYVALFSLSGLILGAWG